MGKKAKKKGKQKATRAVPFSRQRTRGWFKASVADPHNMDWLLADVPINDALHWGLDAMRSRSRDLYRNNEYMKFFVSQLKRNVPGPTGIRFQNRAMNNNGLPRRQMNTTVEAVFKQWSAAGAFDVTGRITKTFGEWMIWQGLATDGEVLIRKHRREDASEMGFAWQFLDPARLSTQLNDTAPQTGNQIVMGIEESSLGKPEAFWLLRALPHSTFRGTAPDPGRYIRVPASEIVHAFIPVEAEQKRGMPMAHAAMRALKNVGGWNEAAIINARLGADKHQIWKTPTGTLDPDTESESGTLTEDNAPGESRAVPADWEVVDWTPNYPSSEVTDFQASMLRGVAGGLDQFYPVLGNDFGAVNLSSIRAGLQDTREGYKLLQQFEIEAIWQPFMPDWQAMMVLRGYLGPASVVMPHWQPRGWMSPEPHRDAQANAINYAMRTTSLTRICAQRGDDFEEIADEIAREHEMLDAREISVMVLGSFQSDAGEEQADTDSEDERKTPRLVFKRRAG